MKAKVLFLFSLFIIWACFNKQVPSNELIGTWELNEWASLDQIETIEEEQEYFDIVFWDNIEDFRWDLVKIEGDIQDNRKEQWEGNSISFWYIDNQWIFQEESVEIVTDEEKVFLLEFNLGEEKSSGEHYFDLQYQDTLHRVYIVGPDFDVAIFEPDDIDGLSSLNFLSLNKYQSHLWSQMTLVINDSQ